MAVPKKVQQLVPGTSRRQEYSASTKRALVDVAAELFTAQGYAGTSLDEIVSGAQVTKGALYHHFTGKQALFEAVFERVEDAASASIRRAVSGTSDYRRLVVQEGPAVLGYEKYREQGERSTYGIVQDIVSSVLDRYDLEQSMVETFSRVFFGAMSAAGSAVSSADDSKRAGAEVEAAIAFILAGLRQQAESGGTLPGPADLVGEVTGSDQD